MQTACLCLCVELLLLQFSFTRILISSFVGTDCELDTDQFDLDNEEDVNELDKFDAARQGNEYRRSPLSSS